MNHARQFKIQPHSTHQAKHLCILVQAPFWHLFGTSIFCSGGDYTLFWCYFGQLCIKFGGNLVLFFLKKDAGTGPSSGAIWDECSEQY